MVPIASLRTSETEPQEDEDRMVASSGDRRPQALVRPPALRKLGMGLVAKITRTHAGEVLGLRLETFDAENVYIAAVAEGADAAGNLPAVCRYNQQAPERRRIRRGDYVWAVNGVHDAAAMQREMREAAELHLDIQRPVIINTEINARGETLVLPVTCCAGGATLVLTPSPQAAPALTERLGMRPGDRIVGVNDCSGSAIALLGGLRTSQGRVRIAVSRRPGRGGDSARLAPGKA